MDSFSQTKIHNHHRLGHSLIASGIFLFLIFSLLFSAISTSSAVAFGTSTIFDLTNRARQSGGLSELRLDENLTAAAQEKADAMVANDYFEHTAPDGTTGWDYIDKTGYVYTFAGENLAASNENDVSVVDGWLNSPGHRANLLNSEFSDVGLGIAYKDSYGDYRNVFYIVALYAEPAAPKSTPLSKTNSTNIEGLKQLGKDKFTLGSGLGYVFIGVSGALTLSGVSIEVGRIKNHLHKHRA